MKKIDLLEERNKSLNNIDEALQNALVELEVDDLEKSKDLFLSCASFKDAIRRAYENRLNDLKESEG